MKRFFAILILLISILTSVGWSSPKPLFLGFLKGDYKNYTTALWSGILDNTKLYIKKVKYDAMLIIVSDEYLIKQMKTKGKNLAQLLMERHDRILDGFLDDGYKICKFYRGFFVDHLDFKILRTEYAWLIFGSANIVCVDFVRKAE